jgi:membrane-associated phospholipid phosphatase
MMLKDAMEIILNWGIEVVLWFQQFSPGFDLPFQALTFLGDEVFYLLFMPLVYWSIDRRTGAALFILLLFSAYLNAVAKVIADQPRPFNYDARVKPLVHAGGGGLPSGHTQNAVVIWGYLARQYRKTIGWVIAGFFMIGIPLSRIYLGVHFPSDLVGGYLLGALILVSFFRLAPRFENWLAEKGFDGQLLLALVLPILLILLNPTGNTYVLSMIAALFGVSAGFALERRYVRFSSHGLVGKRIIRYFLGIFILFGLWAGLRFAFASLEPSSVFRFVRYSLVGLWGGFGAPWLFVRWKLAERE